jgi:UDP-N-acetylmuramyl pentapeptide phosphotransferase/UDP-N-acetylglucosamine-1-phosphate transferase
MEAAGILIPLIVAGVVATLLALPVGRLASALNVVDRPSERSVSHSSNIPLLGGLAVAAGFRGSPPPSGCWRPRCRSRIWAEWPWAAS